MNSKKYVYDFAEGGAQLKSLLGGKGANLAEMTGIGIPVPPGFTITTEACIAFSRTGQYPEGLADEVESHLQALERTTGKGFGDRANALLVSVRSGSVFSMPGMMDTVLNLGLNDDTVAGLAETHRQSPLRLRLLPPLHPDVRRRGHGRREPEVRGCPHREEDRGGSRPRHRPLGGRPQRPHRAFQGGPGGGYRRRLPHRSAGAARPGHSGGLPQLGQPSGQGVPQVPGHPRRPGNGRERAVHGLRQQGRDLRHRRRLHPRPVHR